MATTYHKIHLKGDYEQNEADAGGAITPGMLIALNSDGDVVAHATEGGVAEKTWAIEDVMQGNDIDDAYAATGDSTKVQYVNEKSGNEVYAYIKAGEDIAVGDILISAGDGTLIEDGSEDSSTTIKQYIAIALEALDLTSSTAVATRLRVRVL